MPPRRILMLAACPFPSPQGSQVFIRHLATALNDVGHGVHLVCYARGHTPPPAPLPFAVHRAPGPHVGGRSGPSVRRPLADIGLLVAASQLLRRRRFDLIHAHNVEGQAVGIVLRNLFGVPLVYHCHNAMQAELPTYFAGNAARVAAHAGSLLDTWLPRAADAVITFDTEHAAEHVARGTQSRRVHVVPPGILKNELGGVQAAEASILRASLGFGPVALYAGNPDPYQNLDLLWRAWAQVHARLPTARLLVASHHPSAAFGSVRPGVRYLQTHALSTLRAAHAVAQVAVCPRVLPTGAPIKVLNYLAAGLPVVACKQAARHLVPAVGGCLVQADPGRFAEAIVRALAHPRAGICLPQHLWLPAQMSLYAAAYARALAAFRGRRRAP